MIKLNEATILQLLPPNFRREPHDIALSTAIRKEFQDLLKLSDQVLVYPVVSNLQDELLNQLAKQFNIQGYDETLALEKKRNLVQNALFFYIKAGTKQAVEEKIAGIFGDAELVEWFEENGEPFTFSIETSNAMANTIMERQCRLAVTSTKNARSHLSDIFINTSGQADFYLGMVTESQEECSSILVLIP